MTPLKLALLGLTLLASTARAQAYRPEALREVIQHASELRREGRQPVVLFDLDDTLINTRERTLRILKDFAASIREANPETAAKLEAVELEQIRFQMADTLQNAGIHDAALTQQANDFWLARFFTNEYSAKDVQNPGAALYLHLLARAGARIVYLTGRDEPRMGNGTRGSLVRNRFPVRADQATLLLKPDQSLDDLKFKESQYGAVAAMGDVIAAFENEPANINSMADAFPQAQAIFLDTIHSPKPDVPEARVDWVKDFRLP